MTLNVVEEPNSYQQLGQPPSRDPGLHVRFGILFSVSGNGAGKLLALNGTTEPGAIESGIGGKADTTTGIQVERPVSGAFSPSV